MTPPTGQPVSVPEGNKFVYSAASGAGTPTPGIEVDRSEVEEFLSPALWPSLEAELKQFNQDVAPRIADLDSVDPGSIKFTNSQPLRGHEGSVSSVSWSPDGQILASGSVDGTVRLWHEDGKPIIPLPHGCKVGCDVNSVAWSPDGQILASGGNQGIRLWSRDGRLITPITANTIIDLSWSPDGQTLASASIKSVQLWQKDGRPIRTFPIEHDNGYSVAWSPKGQTLATNGWNTPSPMVQLRRQDGILISTLTASPGHAHSLRWSPDGQILAIADRSGPVKLWRHQDGTLITFIHESIYTYTGRLSWSPDGQILASAGVDGVKLWWRNGTFITTISPKGDGLAGLSWSPDGRTLAGAGNYGTVWLWRR